MRPALAFRIACGAAGAAWLFTCGCASTTRHDSTTQTEPIPRAQSDKPLTAEQTSNMAADDAETFRPAPAKQEPSRRPPDPRRRRVVDQPRIRP